MTENHFPVTTGSICEISQWSHYAHGPAPIIIPREEWTRRVGKKSPN